MYKINFFNRVFWMLLAVGAAAVFVSCEKDENPPAGAQIVLSDSADKEQTAFADNETTGSFTFSAQQAWTATVTSEAEPRAASGAIARASSVPWLRLMLDGEETYTGAAGEFTLETALEENLSGENRKATITITSGADNITVNVTQYAVTEGAAEYWEVTWELNGGAWTAEDNHAEQVFKGGTLAEPVAPTKGGSTFAGWYKEVELVNPVTFPYDVSDVTADFTLYAKWTGNSGGSDLINHSRLAGKWDAGANSANIMFVEFIFEGYYIAAIASADEEEDPAGYFGTYSIDGNTITLSGLGTIEVESLSDTEINYKFGTVDINATKAQLMVASEKTTLLCRMWEVTAENTNMSEDDGYIPTEIGTRGYFSRTGTWLVVEPSGRVGVGAWKWKSEADNQIYYCPWLPAEWDEEGVVTIESLTSNNLIEYEEFFTEEDGTVYYSRVWFKAVPFAN